MVSNNRAGQYAKHVPQGKYVAEASIVGGTAVTVFLLVFPFTSRFCTLVAGMMDGNVMTVAGVTMERVCNDVKTPKSWDAAARLPGGIGTRRDICTLVTDSQFIIEHISEEHIYVIVRGALDGLHSELDPCVRLDRETYLWVYLHGERGEVDFDDHGPRSRHNGRRAEGVQREGKSGGVGFCFFLAAIFII